MARLQWKKMMDPRGDLEDGEQVWSAELPERDPFPRIWFNVTWMPPGSGFSEEGEPWSWSYGVEEDPAQRWGAAATREEAMAECQKIADRLGWHHDNIEDVNSLITVAKLTPPLRKKVYKNGVQRGGPRMSELRTFFGGSATYLRHGTRGDDKMPTLKEFFAPMLEGPRDPAFKPAPELEVPPEEGLPPEPGMDDPGALGPPGMTQDVAKMSASSLDFFSKNVNSALQKAGMDGFDSGALLQFAQAMDSYAYETYGLVADPAARQGFEAEYQKMAADWSTDVVKLLGKLKQLQAHQHG